MKAKRKVLVPLDGTERSMHSLDFIKKSFSEDSVEIVLMHVKELIFIDGISLSEEIKEAEITGKKILDKGEELLKGYNISKYFTFGYPGDETIRKAEEDNIDIIIMTKSTKKGLTRMIGSVTAFVVKHAKCVVMIIPE